MSNKLTDSEMEFIFATYGVEIKQYLNSEEVVIAFFSESEHLADTRKSYLLNKLLANNQFKVSVFNDFSLEKEKEILTDYAECKINGKKFIKIVTPFTRSRSYDLIIMKSDEAESIYRSLFEAREIKNFKSDDFPLIGIDIEGLKKDSIDFLLDDDLRNFCIKHFIPLKRGLIFSGKPGCGKSCSLRWLKNEALKNGVKFTIFSDVEEFVRSKDEFYNDEKKIFVFEDFDAALKDRNDTGNAPNQVLGTVLNILDGVNKISDIVCIFTTNHPEFFDEAFVRPGRIDKVINFNLPTRDQQIDFFKAYLPDEHEKINEILEIMTPYSTNISYAMLKSICDEINISKFNKKEINRELITNFVIEKFNSSNRGQITKNKSEFIL